MPRRTKKWTKATLERRIREGRGQGEKANYIPWVLETDFSAHSTCSVIKGWKHGREHHLLSYNGERRLFYCLEWSDKVVEIREQFPLNVDRAMRIARNLGKKYPKEGGVPRVLTTDFLILVLCENKIRRVVRTVKLKSGLFGNDTFDSLEIDRRYWAEEEDEVDWGITTDVDVPEPVVSNVSWFHESRDIRNLAPLLPDEIRFIAQYFCGRIDIGKTITLAPFCLDTDRALGSDHGSALKVAQFLLANKILTIDINTLIETHKPLLIADVRPMDHLWSLK